MSSNSSNLDTAALLSEVNNHDQKQEEEDEGMWWKNVLDLEEAKNQVLFSLPMILTNVFYFSITLVSVMFAGHLGELQLAGATLANSWATVTGFAFMSPSSLAVAIYYVIQIWTGLSGALETLCGQGFGAKIYRMLGIYLQASCIISCSFSIIISILWFYTEPILILLQQDAEISRTAAQYINLEYWAFELLVLLAGLMPNSEETTSLIAMCVNTEAIAYMISYGLSAAASTRVSNELGAGHPNRAKTAMAVTLKLSILLALAVVIALAFGHNIWAAFFSNSSSIIKKFASMTPLLLISITIDSFQGILSGVARGSGWQLLAVWANLGTFYFIGMPIAGLLGFKFKLYAKGLWIGLICGLFCQAAALLFITLYRNWTKIELSEEKDKETRVSV